MLTIYSSDARHLARVRAVLPDQLGAREALTWRDLHTNRRDATSIVLVIPQVDRSDVRPIAQLSEWSSTLALVLVTERNAERLRLLAGVRLDAIVWFEAVATELPIAIARINREQFFLEISDLILRSENLSPLMRSVLARAARQPYPVRSVQRLAALADRTPAALWHHWHLEVRGETALRLEDFLDWLILLRAIQHKLPGRDWSVTAEAVGVDPRTIRRIAHRLTGSTLHRIEMDGFSALTVLCRDHVLRSLISTADSGI